MLAMPVDLQETQTVVLPAAVAEPSPVATPTAVQVAKPLVGGSFEPARIYAARAGGVVTIFSFFGSERQASQAAWLAWFVALWLAHEGTCSGRGGDRIGTIVIGRKVCRA